MNKDIQNEWADLIEDIQEKESNRKIYIYAVVFFSVAFATIGALLVTLYNNNILTILDIVKISVLSIVIAILIEYIINK